MDDPGDYTQDELLACLIARELHDGETIGVGAASPVPAAALLLAKATHAPTARPLIIGSRTHFPFRDGSKEFFDFAQRGRLDVFFLSGAQIDQYGNINLHCIGDYEAPKVRLPGARGSAMLYYMARRVILFRGEHTPRVFVPQVDFITCPGSTSPSVYRLGGLDKVITPLLTFQFQSRKNQPRTGRLQLVGLHPGVSFEEAQQQTGFSLDRSLDSEDDEPPHLPPPHENELLALRGRVRDELALIYPQFVERRIRQPQPA